MERAPRRAASLDSLLAAVLLSTRQVQVVVVK